ncbi:uncharacterized protein DUF4123 [Cricetibacter osteomyelitidis]|uniref:Uncharacterized protein DUF4123 n=1 Tax=Cricetibacter osteomyelitidis TaxID=1521931 RepID=A0A4R2T5R0_9PAST|nr:DUF4123 domain-containing protein [Cricetibacter osteomyelitidis]TCP97770.1 uncharacterized protein DUF4123 [Cricetibacter osteomyelitidis]
MAFLWIQLGQYRIEPQTNNDNNFEADETEKPVAVLAFVENKAEFDDLIHHSAATKSAFRPTLSALPAEVFIQRHGMTWLVYETKGGQRGEVRIIELGGSVNKAPTEMETDYLLRHQIHPVELLDRQFGRHPKLFAPDEIAKLLFPDLPIPPDVMQRGWEQWQQPTFPPPVTDPKTTEKDTALFGENLPPLKCYFILDANKHPLLHPEEFECRSESLFKGKFGEETKGVAPYLIEVHPYPDYRIESELMGLFHDKNAMTTLNWHENLGIFIHSRHDFDTVFNHLRKFPILKDESGKWFFFRFYDPKVLRNYLNIIANSPEKLSKFFGYDERIIHAFGSGYDDSFYYYQLNALPEDILPAPIMLTNWEIDGFKEQKWLRTKEELTGYIMQTYPSIVSEHSQSQFERYLDEARNKGYNDKISVMQYAAAKQSAVQRGINFDELEMQLVSQISDITKRTQALWDRLVEGIKG